MILCPPNTLVILYHFDISKRAKNVQSRKHSVERSCAIQEHSFGCTATGVRVISS